MKNEGINNVRMIDFCHLNKIFKGSFAYAK